MILGVGVDLVHVPRIAGLISRCGDRALRRLFHPIELQHRPAHESRAIEYFASRWAIKEAVFKAFGARLNAKEIYLTPNRKTGKPALSFEGNVQSIANTRGVQNTHFSISHENDNVIAFVILEGSTSPNPASSSASSFSG